MARLAIKDMHRETLEDVLDLLLNSSKACPEVEECLIAVGLVWRCPDDNFIIPLQGICDNCGKEYVPPNKWAVDLPNPVYKGKDTFTGEPWVCVGKFPSRQEALGFLLGAYGMPPEVAQHFITEIKL